MFSGEGFDPATEANPLITLNIAGLVNHYSLKASESIQLETQDSSGNKIDGSTDNLTVEMTTTREMNSITITPASKINGAINDYRIEVNSVSPMPDGAKFFMTFPVETNLPTSSTCRTYSKLTSVSCAVLSGQQLIATLDFTSNPLSALTTFSFIVESVTNPPSTVPSSTFYNILTQDEFGYDMATYSANVVVTNEQPWSIATGTLSMSDTNPLAASTYTLSITAKNPIPAGGAFVVTTPTNVDVGGINFCSVTVDGSIYKMSCSADELTGIVRVNSGLT